MAGKLEADDRALRLLNPASGVRANKNLCAQSVGDTLGYRVGDAHQSHNVLKSRGWQRVKPGDVDVGDVVSYPFTFGRKRTQHIGYAVRLNGKLMLASNLSGRRKITRLAPGYIAMRDPKGQPLKTGAWNGYGVRNVSGLAPPAPDFDPPAPDFDPPTPDDL